MFSLLFEFLWSCFTVCSIALFVVVLGKAVVVMIEQRRAQQMLSAYDGPAPLFPWGNILDRARNRVNLADWHLENVKKYCTPEKGCFAVYAPFFFRSFSGSGNELVSADPKMVKHVLQDRFEIWSKSHVGGRYTTAVELSMGHGIFLADHGEYAEYPRDGGRLWNLQRRLIVGVMTHSLFKNYYQEVFQHHSLTLVETLKQKVGQCGENAVDFQFWMHVLTMDSLVKLAFGSDLGGVEGKPSDYTLAYDRVTNSALKFGERNIKFLLLRELLPVSLGDFVQKTFIDSRCPVMAEVKQDMETLHNHSQKLIDSKRQHIKEGKEGAEADLLAHMLRDLQENPIDGDAVTDKEIRDIIQHFIVAGRDTTAETLSWLFYELGLEENAVLLQTVQDELHATLQGEAPTHEDLNDLPFLRALMWETMRLHPVGYQIQVTSKLEDTLPDGVTVPKGTRMALSVYALGRSKELYGEDAEEFKPERWIPFKQPNQYNFPMFKAGRRICPGKDMALLEMGIAAAVLLQNFAPKVVDPSAVTISSKLTLSPRDMNAEKDILMLRLIPRDCNHCGQDRCGTVNASTPSMS